MDCDSVADACVAGETGHVRSESGEVGSESFGDIAETPDQDVRVAESGEGALGSVGLGASEVSGPFSLGLEVAHFMEFAGGSEEEAESVLCDCSVVEAGAGGDCDVFRIEAGAQDIIGACSERLDPFELLQVRSGVLEVCGGVGPGDENGGVVVLGGDFLCDVVGDEVDGEALQALHVEGKGGWVEELHLVCVLVGSGGVLSRLYGFWSGGCDERRIDEMAREEVSTLSSFSEGLRMGYTGHATVGDWGGGYIQCSVVRACSRNTFSEDLPRSPSFCCEVRPSSSRRGLSLYLNVGHRKIEFVCDKLKRQLPMDIECLSSRLASASIPPFIDRQLRGALCCRTPSLYGERQFAASSSCLGVTLPIFLLVTPSPIVPLHHPYALEFALFGSKFLESWVEYYKATHTQDHRVYSYDRDAFLVEPNTSRYQLWYLYTFHNRSSAS